MKLVSCGEAPSPKRQKTEDKDTEAAQVDHAKNIFGDLEDVSDFEENEDDDLAEPYPVPQLRLHIWTGELAGLI